MKNNVRLDEMRTENIDWKRIIDEIDIRIETQMELDKALVLIPPKLMLIVQSSRQTGRYKNRIENDSWGRINNDLLRKET